MKKYIRKIVVNSKNYTWRSGQNNCDGDGSNLITIQENKKQIYHKLINGNIQITPSLVKKIIDDYNVQDNDRAGIANCLPGTEAKLITNDTNFN